MSKKLRTAVVLCGSVLLLLVGFVGSVYWASQRVPDFYQQALQTDPTVQQTASDELLAGATALASNVRKQGRWHALFTTEQINGWLAVDLAENHPDLLPPEVIEPRLTIGKDHATIACRYEDGTVSTVVSIDVELYVAEPNVVALRIGSVRAGALPIPLTQLLDGLSDAVRQLDLQLRWLKSEGDPVALITIPPTRDGDETVYQLDTLQLRDGALYVAGRTQRAEEPPRNGSLPAPIVADQSPLNLNNQR